VTAAAVLAALYVAPLALRLPLLDPDEGLHAAISQEMVERGDWVTPRFLGQPFLDKPILFFWAQAASLRLLGSSEAAIRGVGLGFAVLGAVAVGWLGRRLLGTGAGATACVVYATMLLPLALAQTAVHDVALVPWVVLAVAAFWEARFTASARGTLAWSVLAGVWLGLALLTKGLVGVAVVGLAVGAWLIWEGAVSLRLVGVGVLALAVAAVVGAPWYVAMERANPGYLRYFIVERHFLGFTTSTQIHGDRPWWYYVPLVLAGALPWIGWIGASRETAGGAGATRSARRLSWCWLAGGWGFLSTASSKLVTYILPVFAPLALLAALDATTAWRERPRALARAPRLVSAGAMALVLPALLLAGRRWFGVSGSLALAWTVAAILIAAWVAVGRARKDAGTFAWTAWLTVVTVWAALLLAIPPVARAFSARDLAAVINAHGRFPERLWVFDERVGSLIFYLDPPIRRGLTADRVANVGLDRILGMRQAVPGTLVAVPLEWLERIDRRVSLAGVPYEDAGAHRLYTTEALVAALQRHQP
jgi:4-amino-4-deoxy-L-arabinose transferase